MFRADSRWIAILLLVAITGIVVACGGAAPEDPETEPTGEPAAGNAPAPEREAPAVAQTLEMTVEGMTCGHCEASIQREVKFCRGVTKVTASHEAKKVTVEGVGLDEAEVRETIRKLGFRVPASVSASEKPAATKPKIPERP